MAIWLILATTMAAQQVPEFHQGVAYTIEASMDDSATHVLRGRERIRYQNNSPQRIDTLWFHLHLNAFRPNSKWAQRELQFNNRRFQDLGPADHAFERVRSLRVGNVDVKPVFPGAPDSTVMGVPLPRTLAPGESLTLVIDWDARLSTLPRRQGREGRHHNYAQWYPRLAVYDKGGWQVQSLLPQGEFYGEFADYDVTLDVPADQVVGATGVAVSGDPGWERANVDPSKSPDYQRNVYAARAAEPLGLFARDADAGRKRIRWRAERVHHFAWVANPNYAYEGGKVGNTAVHALFLRSDTAWKNVAVARTIKAMQFMESVFGPYTYPQITNVHRVEGGGGTEFPMMIMDVNAGEGLIVHEIAHQWAHGILANNEWKDGWLDEGMASFIGGLYAEVQGMRQNYARMTQAVAGADTAAGAQPIATASADFKDYNSYGMMTYNKAQLVFRMLHDYMGDADFRAAMKLYYDRNKLQHVDEEDFKAAMEAVEKTDLDWFFQQWLHTNHTLDYSVVNAVPTQLPNGTWRTRVDLARSGQAWMPTRLKVGDVVTRIDARDPTFSVTVDTPQRPTEVVIDPDAMLLDLNRSNNVRQITR
jgi:hypothetical protein